VDLIATLARMVLGERSRLPWEEMKRHCNVREMIAQSIPGYESLTSIDQTKQEFHIAGRTHHQPRFATPSGRARFRVHPLPSLAADGHHLRLMTVRSEGQFNTVVYEEEDIYRGQDRRDVILMNRADIARLGLKVDQRVTVRSAAGEMRNILVRAFDIRVGNALMYYPEANVLVPSAVDPDSKTPAFKSVLVRLEA
jgi:anaerobic selenocysteine-containing dehydrogenase